MCKRDKIIKSYKNEKKGQIQLTFNWIYISIAGAIILLFFLGIVVRQASVSQQRLSLEIVEVIDSIFTGASVSEKTKNFIDSSALEEFPLYFDCNDGVSEFGILDQGARTQNAIDPIFTPREIVSRRVITWSLPYKLPFKVIDFLFVTSVDTTYYLTGNDALFVNEFINATDGFSREYVADIRTITVDSQSNEQVRIIDTDGTTITGAVPDNLRELPDSRVTALVMRGGRHLDFYTKRGGVWSKENTNPIPIVSLGGERDAAKYAAIFSHDAALYECNMQKAFRRLEILTQVYGGEEIAQFKAGAKLGEMITYYQEQPQLSLSSECSGHIHLYDENVQDTLAALKNKAAACRIDNSFCGDLISSAQDLRELNEVLRLNCITLY